MQLCYHARPTLRLQKFVSVNARDVVKVARSIHSPRIAGQFSRLLLGMTSLEGGEKNGGKNLKAGSLLRGQVWPSNLGIALQSF